jgi:ABC-type transport system involved in cytochrome bd biosynthesis fused ATPase/permease subunit
MDEEPKRAKRKPPLLVGVARAPQLIVIFVATLMVMTWGWFILAAAITLFCDYMGWPRIITPFLIPGGPNG